MKEQETLKQYLPWIYKHANKYSNLTTHYLEHEDLVSIGSMAVFDAIDRYDPDNAPGAKLDTYVMNHIRHRMQSAMRDAGNYKASQQNAMIMLSSWLKVLGEDATPEEISEYAKSKYPKTSSYYWSVEQAKGYLELWNTKINSLDAPASSDQPDITLLSSRKSDTDIEKEYSVLEEKSILYNEINNLEPRQRRILIGRIVEELTLDDLGAEFGVTRERIRQIEDKALKLVKHRISVKMKEHKPAKCTIFGPKPKKKTAYKPKPKPPVAIPKPVVEKIVEQKVAKRKPEFENIDVAEVRLPVGTKVSTTFCNECVISKDLGYMYEGYIVSVDKYTILKENEIIEVL